MAEHPTFRTIVADPDWRYANFGAAKHGAARAHYPGTEADDMQDIPVSRWSRRDTTLFLWATLPKIDEAIDVMRAWGFSLVTAIPWVKTSPTNEDIKVGIGFWFRATSELVLICRKPAARGPVQDKSGKQLGLLTGDPPVFYAPLGAHSRKPPSLMEWIESRMPGPRLELYATGAKPGWTCWGHSTGYHLDRFGVTSFAVMKQNDYERWLRTHPLMTKLSNMNSTEFRQWKQTEEAKGVDPQDAKAARAVKAPRKSTKGRRRKKAKA